MSSNTASSRPAVLGVPLLVLLTVTSVLRPLERRAWVPVALRAEQATRVAAHGGALALLGGMRAAAASACWLRANLAWERREARATTGWIELAVALDERPLYFWLNGALIIACDLPEWRHAPAAPAAWRARVNEEQAQQALAFLEEGQRWHGADPMLDIEMANIHLRRRNDPEAAARCYRRAAEQPGAPYYAARIYAELLRGLGRPQEALSWLRQVFPTLPAADPLARREVVQERIKLLERETAVP